MPWPGGTYPEGGTHTLKAISRRYGMHQRSFDPTSPDPLRIELTEPASLELTLAGYAESPLAGLCVVYLKNSLSPTGMGFSGGGAGVSPEGGVVFDRLQPGKRLAVIVVQDGYQMIQVAKRSLEVEEGENRVTWTLPELHTVEVPVEIAKGTEGPRLTLRALDPAGNWVHQFAKAEEDGTVRFRHVPEGRYEIEGRYKGKNVKRPVDVPAQTVVRLD